MDDRQSRTLTSFLLPNVHCPSHEPTIRAALDALEEDDNSISFSTEMSWVTVQHDRSILPDQIVQALEDAGFGVSHSLPANPSNEGALSRSESQGEAKSKLRKWISKFSNIFSWTPQTVSFQDEDYRRLEEGDVGISRGLTPPMKAIDQPKTRNPRGRPHEQTLPPLIEFDSDSFPEREWQASLAIGGMTCAACAGTITQELKNKGWVRDVSVNLLANSATVNFVGEQHKDDIAEAIEDMGFDAVLDNVREINQFKPTRDNKGIERTVDILVTGMFDGRCTSRILDAVSRFGDRVFIERPPTPRNPILRLTYTSDAPSFTIRHIMAAISSANEAFQPSIYHPPSLEDRSRWIHARNMRKLVLRVLLSFIIAIPTLIIGVVYMSLVPANDSGRQYLEQPLFFGVSRSQCVLFVLASPVYFFCADVFHKRAITEVQALWRRGSKAPFFARFYRFGSMSLLMSLGTSIAYISSVAQLIAAMCSHRRELVNDNSFYFDSVVFLTFFLLLGRLIESYSKSKTDDAVAMLGKMRPTQALLMSPAEEYTAYAGTPDSGDLGIFLTLVDVDLLEVGDMIKVRHGGSPPCDGIVIQGDSEFDESSLTGEPKFVKKKIGDGVFSGTINKGPPVSVKITGAAGYTVLDHIIKAVREGQTRRAPIERIADTLTSYFVPFVTFIAILTCLVWLGLGCCGNLPDSYLPSGSSWVPWSLEFAIAVFVVACPCGLALAAPTALFVGGGLAAKHGILVKGGGEAFETANRLDCIVFDKTGTLTMGGEPVVTDFDLPLDFLFEVPMAITHETVLSLICNVEESSSHTIARAIASFCKNRELQALEVEHIEELPGKGMKAIYEDKSSNVSSGMIIGNENLMTEYNVTLSPSYLTTLNTWKTQGKSVALAAFAFDVANSPLPTYHLCALFAISDPIRPEAPGVIAALQKRGKQVWMLSGDNYITANAVGSQVGIPSTNIIAGVFPHQKSEKIRFLQHSLKDPQRNSKPGRARVAMVGDGINDSPALTVADVGIAIGSGSDIAISSAGFILIQSNLNSLVTLLDLSRVVVRRIQLNFFWALIYNLVALPVAAGVLYPISHHGRHIRLDPVWASLAMALSSISVVLSSLALKSNIPFVGFRKESNK